jgi:hypothetical protein
MKAKTLLILSFLAMHFLTYSQEILPSSKEVKTFLESKTYIVQDNNIFGMYNTAIEEAAKKHWKLTPYSILSKDEFQKKKNVPTASMIVQTESHFEGQEELGVFTSLSLVLGKQGADINSMPDIITLPLAYSDVDYDQYYYKLGLALVFMQRHVNWLKDNPDVEDKVLLNHFKNSRKSTKDKMLYVLKNEMEEDINTLEKIKTVYSGDVKFVTKEEIESAVDTKAPNVLVLHLVAPANAVKGCVVTKMILSAADAEIYYFDYHRVKGKNQPNKFLKTDFMALNEL